MNEPGFLETVRREAPIDSNHEAREVTEATLRTLGKRVTAGEAEGLRTPPAVVGRRRAAPR